MKGMNNISQGFTFLFFCSFLHGQVVPDIAPPQTKSIQLENITIHTGNGDVIQHGFIRFDQGKIMEIGSMHNAPTCNSSDCVQVNGKRRQCYPGFIALNTELGLSEIEAAIATQDHEELGGLNPEVRSIISYNTDSHIIPTVRSNGVLMAQICPGGNNALIKGQSSIVQLDAWNWEDAALSMDEGIILQWPTPDGNLGNPEKAKEYDQQVKNLIALLEEAKVFVPNPKEPQLKLQVMRAMMDGKKTCYVQADLANAIQDAVVTLKKYKIKTVIVGGQESWLVKDILKENKIPVVFQAIHRLPLRPEDDVDRNFKTPGELLASGITVALALPGSWHILNLPFIAGETMGHGVSEEQALQMITKNPAIILGMQDRIGTLEKGKDATFFISNGDVLEILGNQIEAAWIQGRQINLDNKHKQLYRRFMKKYGLNPQQN